MNALNQCRALGFALAILAAGATTAHGQKDVKDPAPVGDREFAAQALTIAKAEVRLNELAAKQTDNDKVKGLAQQLAKEQSKLVDQLTDATRGMKIGLDYEMEKDLQAAYDRLALLRGADFDRAFVKQVVRDQEKVVVLFDGEAKSGTIADLKALANEMLPRLKERLKDARAAADGVKAK